MKIIIASNKIWNHDDIKNLSSVKNISDIKIIEKNEELDIKFINFFKPDYIFFTHWSYYINPTIFKNYTCVLFHMTDLPFGRGGSPLQNLILKGFTKTKISAITVDKELDAGEIYLKHTLDLNGSAQEIYKRASKIIYNYMIPQIINKLIVPKKQQGQITYFTRRQKHQSEIPPDLNSLEKLYDFIRMLDADSYPKAFIKKGAFVYEMYDAKFVNGNLKCQVTVKRVENE